jgi:quercetin dioxygenase-like cupin family protein
MRTSSPWVGPLLLALCGCAATPKVTGGVKVVSLGTAEQDYVELRRGPPETASMESGAVSLAPGKTVGMHDTGSYEELLVPLEGRGELRVPGRPSIPLAPGLVAYSPPHTSHDVANVGPGIFRYVFVAARAP